ncbi:4'-phosphopantetheinyl transferase superfamily protein [uncultured Arthrobacter sp.]|uniref:4'-phosphopantetheinyl transferase family protein n=1 Tax=uncultured Arthrobacter sp. TaxID=114050 RepID=UPI0028D30EC7|nr:4'-phosphopantetheinyl transferase superfamily protein [uncultured Arthrobacter sp.]
MERPAEQGIEEPDVDRILLAGVRLSAADLGQAGILDYAERRLALSFGSGVHRDRFLAGRIALRRHAAEAAGVSAGALQADFVCQECTKDDHVHGMPRYRVDPSGVTVLASLSRAGDWCLLAATVDEQVLGLGVDLEATAAAGFDGFGGVALSDPERQHLQGVEPALRPRVQTLLWTRKEAVLKALGRGLAAVDPSLVDVAGPVPVLRGHEGGPHRWLLRTLNTGSVGLPDSFTASLAVLLDSGSWRRPVPGLSGAGT